MKECYENFGLMVLLRNPEAIRKLRSYNEISHAELAETALCKAANISPRDFSPKRKSRAKSQNSEKKFAVKIQDKRLIAFILNEKSKNGICHRFTVEKAILRYC